MELYKDVSEKTAAWMIEIQKLQNLGSNQLLHQTYTEAWKDIHGPTIVQPHQNYVKFLLSFAEFALSIGNYDEAHRGYRYAAHSAEDAVVFIQWAQMELKFDKKQLANDVLWNNRKALPQEVWQKVLQNIKNKEPLLSGVQIISSPASKKQVLVQPKLLSGARDSRNKENCPMLAAVKEPDKQIVVVGVEQTIKTPKTNRDDSEATSTKNRTYCLPQWTASGQPRRVYTSSSSDGYSGGFSNTTTSDFVSVPMGTAKTKHLSKFGSKHLKKRSTQERLDTKRMHTNTSTNSTDSSWSLTGDTPSAVHDNNAGTSEKSSSHAVYGSFIDLQASVTTSSENHVPQADDVQLPKPELKKHARNTINTLKSTKYVNANSLNAFKNSTSSVDGILKKSPSGKIVEKRAAVSGAAKMNVLTPQPSFPAAVEAKWTSASLSNNAVLPTEPTVSGTVSKKSFVVKGVTYQRKKCIGSGGSAKVYEVSNPNGAVLALKYVCLDGVDDSLLKSYIKEIDVLMQLKDCPQVIDLHDWEIRNEDLYMVMEKGEQDLHTYLKSKKTIEPSEVKALWHMMLLAVQAVHNVGIIHNDIKPANFIFVKSQIKLIDFGIAKSIQANRTSVTIGAALGTMNYMAPESFGVVSADIPRQPTRVNRALDVWSLGCVLYYMVYRKTPYQDITNQYEKANAICKGLEIPFPAYKEHSLVEAIKKCLQLKPHDRCTISDLLVWLYDLPPPKMMTRNTGKPPTQPQSVISEIWKNLINSPASAKRISRMTGEPLDCGLLCSEQVYADSRRR